MGASPWRATTAYAFFAHRARDYVEGAGYRASVAAHLAAAGVYGDRFVAVSQNFGLEGYENQPIA